MFNFTLLPFTSRTYTIAVAVDELIRTLQSEIRDSKTFYKKDVVPNDKRHYFGSISEQRFKLENIAYSDYFPTGDNSIYRKYISDTIRLKGQMKPIDNQKTEVKVTCYSHPYPMIFCGLWFAYLLLLIAFQTLKIIRGTMPFYDSSLLISLLGILFFNGWFVYKLGRERKFFEDLILQRHFEHLPLRLSPIHREIENDIWNFSRINHPFSIKSSKEE